MSRDFGELFSFASVGMTFVTALLVLYVIVLAFARDKVVRPRLFSWGAILFAVSIIIPLIGLMFIGLMGTYSMGGGGRGSYNRPGGSGSLSDMFELLVFLVGAGIVIATPLLLAAGILFAIIGLLPKFENRRAQYAPPAQYSSPQNAPPQDRPSQKAPHPLD